MKYQSRYNTRDILSLHTSVSYEILYVTINDQSTILEIDQIEELIEELKEIKKELEQ